MAPSDDDGAMSPGEMGRTLRRIEAAFENFVLKAVFESELNAIREDVADLQDTRRSMSRLVAAALMTALVPALILVFRLKATG